MNIASEIIKTIIQHSNSYEINISTARGVDRCDIKIVGYTAGQIKSVKIEGRLSYVE